MVIFALTTLVGGALSDRYGRKTLFMYVAGVLLIGGYPIFQLFHVNWEFGPLVAQFILAVHIGLFFGVIPAGLSEIFPSHLRFTGLSVSHNISMALFGGSAPLLATGLIELTHDIAAPGILLMVAAVFCLMGMPLYEDRYKVKTI